MGLSALGEIILAPKGQEPATGLGLESELELCILGGDALVSIW